jgi:hypothetical protein
MPDSPRPADQRLRDEKDGHAPSQFFSGGAEKVEDQPTAREKRRGCGGLLRHMDGRAAGRQDGPYRSNHDAKPDRESEQRHPAHFWTGERELVEATALDRQDDGNDCDVQRESHGHQNGIRHGRHRTVLNHVQAQRVCQGAMDRRLDGIEREVGCHEECEPQPRLEARE